MKKNGSHIILFYPNMRSNEVFYKGTAFSVGAKSQILSSVAPPRKKNLVTIFSQGHVLGPWKPMFY